MLTIVHYFPRIRREEGGVVQAVLDVCGVMAGAGHHVTLATCDATDVPGDWSSGGTTPRVVVLEKSALFPGCLSRRGKHSFHTLLAGTDVAHLHTPWELSNLQLAAVLRDRGVPFVMTVHGMLDDYSMRQKRLKKRAFLNLGGRGLFTKAATVHFTAQAEKEQAARWIPGEYRPVVQPCAIDLSQFGSLPGPQVALSTFPQLATETRKVLFLSRLHPKKGIELLIDAVGQLRARGLRVELLIAGPGENGYVERLRRQVGERDLAESTHFLGMVGGPVKLSLYQLADMFVLPTYQENFGLVLPEALACGTPVVTTRGVDTWRELVAAGARVVDNQPGAIATTLAELLGDDRLRRELGQRGRQYVMNWLAPAKVVAGYEDMYRETVGRTGRSASDTP